MDDAANLADGALEDAVRAGVSNHEAREVRGVGGGLRAEVGHVDVPLCVARDGDDFHAGHHGAGGVRAVRAVRDEADVAVRLAVRREILGNDQQARVFALRAGVGLERDAREAGDFPEPLLKLLEQFLVAEGLLERRERMDFAELRPRDREHLARGVELHRAGAEGNHRLAEREVARFELAQVAQHLGLGVVAVEDGCGEEFRGARVRAEGGCRCVPVKLLQLEGQLEARVEDAHEQFHIRQVRRLVECDAERGFVQHAQVDAVLLGDGDDFLARVALELDSESVEVASGDHRVAELRDARREQASVPMDALRDGRKALRSVVNRIHRRDVREQCLRGADVRRGLLATDVLLARAEREAQADLAARVLRDADEPAWHVALESIARGEERRVRPAVTQRNAETLRTADTHIRAELTRRAQHREREDIRRDDDERARRVGFRREVRVVQHRAGRGGVLHERAEDRVVEGE